MTLIDLEYHYEFLLAILDIHYLLFSPELLFIERKRFSNIITTLQRDGLDDAMETKNVLVPFTRVDDAAYRTFHFLSKLQFNLFT